MDTVTVREVGIPADGASKSRYVLTTGGKRHVKFVRSDGEGPHSLASEHLTLRLMELFGVDRPRFSHALLPRGLASTPEFRTVTHPVGIASEIVLALDLRGPMIADAAIGAPCSEIVAQYVVLDWVRSSDHVGKNFLLVQGRVIGIDFCAAPNEATWECHPIPADTPDHGQLAVVVARCDADAKERVIAQLDAIDAACIEAIFSEMPDGWATKREQAKMIEKLLARKEEVRARYLP